MFSSWLELQKQFLEGMITLIKKEQNIIIQWIQFGWGTQIQQPHLCPCNFGATFHVSAFQGNEQGGMKDQLL